MKHFVLFLTLFTGFFTSHSMTMNPRFTMSTLLTEPNKITGRGSLSYTKSLNRAYYDNPDNAKLTCFQRRIGTEPIGYSCSGGFDEELYQGKSDQDIFRDLAVLYSHQEAASSSSAAAAHAVNR